MKKRLLVTALCLLPALSSIAQWQGDVYTCDTESYNLLKSLSDSRLSRGEMYVFTTTHQDLAWLNHLDACIADRDTLWLTPFLQRLAAEPDFRMDIEQTSILKEYIHRHPQTHPLFTQYMKEGRICVGGAFIQPYEEMYAGESLARQFYLGVRWLKKNFDGYRARSYFNVDVPGRTLQMPQILKKAGIDNLIISRHEKGLFYWQSPDGSKVRTYTPGHYIYFYDVLAKEDTAAVKEIAKEAVAWYTKYNDVKKAPAVMPAMLNYELSWDRKPVANCAVLMEKWNGIRAIKEEVTGKQAQVTLPRFRYATADDFFNALDLSTSSLPVVGGERPNVWLYIHGPSHEKALTASRAADVWLPAAEKLASCYALLHGSFATYPAEALEKAWEAKIYPDHGWGGHGGVMTDNTFRRKFEFALSESRRIAEAHAGLIASSVQTSPDKGRPLVLLNHLSFSRTAPVRVELRFESGYARELCVADAEGHPVVAQLADTLRYADGSIEKATLCFMAKDVPAMGLATYYISSASAPSVLSASARSLGPGIVENDFYKIELAGGGIKQIYDKAYDCNLLNTDKFLGGEVITMRSVGNGAGEFDAVQQPDMEGFDKTSNHEANWVKIADGPVYTAYKTRIPIRHAIVEQTLTVYHPLKKIDVDVALKNWEEVMFREFRQMWPLAFPRSAVSYEVPFGALTVGKDEMPGAAGERYDVENSRQRPRGIGNWLSAAGETCAVTLSSSVAVADYVDPTDYPVAYPVLQPILLASRRSCHAKGNDFFQPGDHTYRFSFTSHAVGDIAREEFGQSANAPLVAVYNPQPFRAASLPEVCSFVSVSHPQVKITAFKKCEDDNSWILRLYNCSGKEETVSLQMFRRPKEIIHTNLIEEELAPVREIRLGKYAIETYKIRF